MILHATAVYWFLLQYTAFLHAVDLEIDFGSVSIHSIWLVFTVISSWIKFASHIFSGEDEQTLSPQTSAEHHLSQDPLISQSKADVRMGQMYGV